MGLTGGTDFRPGTLRVTLNDDVNIWDIDDRPYNYESEVGRLWVYGDAFVLPTPWPLSPALGEVMPCDVCDCESVNFCFQWKPLPKALRWDIWIALDENFEHVVLQWDDFQPDCCDAPGICRDDLPFNFDCGSTYYWQVRATGTTEGEAVHSRWSAPMHFLVGAGSTVEHMHVAPILEAPEAGASGVGRTPGFSWTGFPSTALYEFQLARDNQFSFLLAREDLNRTAYVYPGALDWGGTYFWRVRALKPNPSEWSLGTFTVIPQPVPQVVPPPSGLQLLASTLPGEGTPAWVWFIMAILVILIILILIYISSKRQR